MDDMDVEGAGRTTSNVRDAYEAAFHAAQEALIIHQGGRIIEANPAAARLLHRPSERLAGTPLLDCLPANERERAWHHMENADDTGLETRVVRPDGSSLPVRMHAATAGAQQVVVLHAEAPTSHDRRDRRRLERDAELSRLEQMNQFKTQLLNTAAHELNTPLTPLRLQVHLLRSQNLGKLSERQTKALDVLERNVSRLSLLVSDILDVARLESGHLTIEPENTDLADLVDESAQSYEETARGVGVELRTECDDDIVVLADPRRLLQVLYNLVSNAIKFTPEGGRVTIRTGAEDDAGYVEVQDTGLGMDAHQLSRLFQPFSRVHDTESTAIPGTGLGLYISRGIIEQHDGEMTVDSPGPGEGATFRITLPLAAEPVRHPKHHERPRSPLVAGPLAKRLRELI